MSFLSNTIRRFLVVFVLISMTNSASSQCAGYNLAFSSGEQVTYHAYYNWGFIWLNAGRVTFSVKSVLWNKKEAYHFKSIGVTHANYDRLFTVRDTFETFVDKETLRPLEFKRITNEGSYSSYHHYLFDSINSRIYSRISKEGGAVKQTTIAWPECSFDVLTMIYQARNIDFSKYKLNDRIPIVMIVEDEIHNLYIRYLGREIVENREGRKFRCLKFSPLLVEGTIFEAGEDMTVWVTDDKNRVPIVVEAKILIGSVKAMFVDAKGLRHKSTSEIK